MVIENILMRIHEETKIIQEFIHKNPNPWKISEKDIHNFYREIIDCLIDHNHQYYIENQPIISDKEYDELFDYLKKIEEYFPQIITSNSPTQWLVGQISEGFKKAEHKMPMLSLENTYNAEDLKERDERIRKAIDNINKTHQEEITKLVYDPNRTGAPIPYFYEYENISYYIEPKIDGLSIELIYKDGYFFKAITRWDGKIWEDVTENVKTIKNIPKKLKWNILNWYKSEISFRWEIVINKSELNRINEERIIDWLTPYSNTRNLAAGSLKQLDPSITASRNLKCYIYEEYPSNIYVSKIEKKKWIYDINKSVEIEFWTKIKSLWFEYLDLSFATTYIKDINRIIEICDNPSTKNILENQYPDIEFDGLVIKIDDIDLRDDIWSTDHHPKRAVAYKFPAQLAATQITSVDVQVGRTGILTPVANFEPVQLSWATLKRVSLHNRDFIKQKDIHINDRIWLQRSGEVIPYIVSVITDRRTGEESVINPPEICPSCHEPVSNRDMHYYCTNTHCPDKIKQQIQHFVSKNCMDIQGIGESIVDILVDNKIIENIADIYKLTDHTIQMQLRRFPWFGDKKVAEIANGVEESKQKALRRLLNGLGISHVGKKMAQDLAKQMINDTLEMIDLVTNQELLKSIYWIGEKSVESISTFFQDKDNIKLLKQLEAYGVNMDPKKYTDHIRTDEVKGSFSITWSFDVSRKTITEYFQRNGYIFNESPTKTTDFILIGEKASSKKNKAQELGIQIYEWWDTIVKQFPFLKHMSTEVKKKPTTQSLF